MTSIDRVGKALYGRRWKTELADALGISKMSLRRYELGERNPPADLARRMRRLVIKRITMLKSLI